MTSEQKATKKPLFYPLTHEEVLDLKNLTGVEIKVFLYVRTLDPFGDRNLEYSVTAVAQELDLSKGAVSKALKSLDAKGFIHVELTRVKIRIKADKSAVASFPIRNDVSQSEPEFPIGNQDCQEETSVSYKKPEFPIGNNQSSKPSPDKASSAPQTIKTYSDLIKTLSESERENFLNFSLEKCKSLPKLPELPMKWIEAHSSELYAQFLSTPEAAANGVANTDWTQHQDWNDWLGEMREGVPRFVALGTCFDRKMRRAIADWADERGLIWGTES